MNQQLRAILHLEAIEPSGETCVELVEDDKVLGEISVDCLWFASADLAKAYCAEIYPDATTVVAEVQPQ